MTTLLPLVHALALVGPAGPPTPPPPQDQEPAPEVALPDDPAGPASLVPS